jgi:hypothetical protein
VRVRVRMHAPISCRNTSKDVHNSTKNCDDPSTTQSADAASSSCPAQKCQFVTSSSSVGDGHPRSKNPGNAWLRVESSILSEHFFFISEVHTMSLLLCPCVLVLPYWSVRRYSFKFRQFVSKFELVTRNNAQPKFPPPTIHVPPHLKDFETLCGSLLCLGFARVIQSRYLNSHPLSKLLHFLDFHCLKAVSRPIPPP